MNAMVKLEGTVLSHDYDDIIDLPYPQNDWNFLMRHPRMSVENRAKIFSPFAALRGHSAVIAETAAKKLTVRQDDLFEDSRQELDEKLNQLANDFQKGCRPEISIVYFEQDNGMEAGIGCYKRLDGILTKFDFHERMIQVVKTKIRWDCIQNITIKTF